MNLDFADLLRKEAAANEPFAGYMLDEWYNEGIIGALASISTTTSASSSASASSASSSSRNDLKSTVTPNALSSVFVRRLNEMLEKKNAVDGIYTNTHNTHTLSLSSSI